MTSQHPSEFSYILQPSTIGDDAANASFDVEASKAECAALAERFGYLELKIFRVSGQLMPRGSLDFRLHGRIKACVVQSCVVTLDPVVNEIDETLDILLRPELGNESPEGEPEEDFEPYGGDAIDVAELAAVELALALDPYPRAPGVTLECIKLRSSAVKLGEQVKDGNDRASEAFRALAALKRNK